MVFILRRRSQGTVPGARLLAKNTSRVHCRCQGMLENSAFVTLQGDEHGAVTFGGSLRDIVTMQRRRIKDPWLVKSVRTVGSILRVVLLLVQ